MYKSRARVYTDIAFHAKFPLVAFLSLVHFWITFFLCIFGGTWRIVYGKIEMQKKGSKSA